MPRKTVSQQILRHVCEAFPHLAPIEQRIACKPSPTHFIEGIAIEKTPYKGTFYIWSLLTPLWAAIRLPILDYSERLAEGDFFEGTEQAMAERAIECVKANPMFLARTVPPETTLESFLSGEAFVSQHSPLRIMAEHRGIALALLGQRTEAITVLGDLVNRLASAPPWPGRPDPPRIAEYHNKLAAIVRSLEAGSDTYLEIINAIETQALAEIGLTRPIKGGGAADSAIAPGEAAYRAHPTGDRS